MVSGRAWLAGVTRGSYRREAVNDAQAPAVSVRTVPSRLTVSRMRITPPALAVQGPAPGLITAHNVTVTGTATDSFSGLASLTASVDGGTAVNVSVSKAGTFGFTTSLALVSGYDGTHTVHLKATDRVGNVSTADVSFVLDTTAPVLTITSPPKYVARNASVPAIASPSTSLLVAEIMPGPESVGNVPRGLIAVGFVASKICMPCAPSASPR